MKSFRSSGSGRGGQTARRQLPTAPASDTSAAAELVAAIDEILAEA